MRGRPGFMENTMAYEMGGKTNPKDFFLTVLKDKRARRITYAMMLTSFPFAFSAILSANFSALASMEPEGGTAATITSTPL